TCHIPLSGQRSPVRAAVPIGALVSIILFLVLWFHGQCPPLPTQSARPPATGKILLEIFGDRWCATPNLASCFNEFGFTTEFALRVAWSELAQTWKRLIPRAEPPFIEVGSRMR